MFYMSINVCFAGEFQYILKIIISHFIFFIRRFMGAYLGPFGGHVGVRLGLLAVLEPSGGDSWPSGRNFGRVGILCHPARRPRQV